MTDTGAGRIEALGRWLRARDDDQLAALLTARPDLATPTPPDLSVLASRAIVRVSLGRALDRLDAFTLTVLDALRLTMPRTEASTAAILGVDVSLVSRAVDTLRDLALAWRHESSGTVRLTPGLDDLLGERPAGLGRPVAVVFERYELRQLASVLTSIGQHVPPSQPEAFARLLEHSTTEDLKGRLALLEPAERTVLEQLARTPVGTVRQASRVEPLDRADSPVRRLLARGLVAAVGAESVELPREVGLLLRDGNVFSGVVTEAPPISSSPVDPGLVDRAASVEASTIVRLVETLLEAWGDDPPPVLKAGGVGVRDVRYAARLLDVDENRLSLLLEIAYAAGLVDRTTDLDGSWAPTSAFEVWTSREHADRWAHLALAWIDTPRMPSLVGERERERALTPLAPELLRPSARETRREVLALLVDMPAGAAVDVVSLRAHLGWMSPRRAGGQREAAVTATLDEAAVLGIIGRGSLSSAGRALLAHKPGDERMADAAKALAPHLPEPVAVLHLQNDLSAIAPGPLVPELAREMAIAAEVESRGAATVHRFTEASIRRAYDAGRTSDELRRLLTAAAGPAGLPQTLDYLLDDVARRHGVLRAGSCQAYLRCDDTVLLDEVVAHKKTVGMGLRRLAPTVVISSVPVQRLLQGLREAGYAPMAEGPDGAVVVSRPEQVRSPLRSRPTPPSVHVLRGEELRRAVRRLRDGDAAAQDRAKVGATGTVDQMLTALEEAAREKQLVEVGYVSREGVVHTRRLVPTATGSGRLSGISGDVNVTISVPSITSVRSILS